MKLMKNEKDQNSKKRIISLRMLNLIVDFVRLYLKLINSNLIIITVISTKKKFIFNLDLKFKRLRENFWKS